MIKRVCVAGAGVIGSLLAGHLAQPEVEVMQECAGEGVLAGVLVHPLDFRRAVQPLDPPVFRGPALHGVGLGGVPQGHAQGHVEGAGVERQRQRVHPLDTDIRVAAIRFSREAAVFLVDIAGGDPARSLRQPTQSQARSAGYLQHVFPLRVLCSPPVAGSQHGHLHVRSALPR